MTQLAILACAGWKGAGRGTPSVRLPAPFLPLGDGTTTASRLSAQFRSLGFDVALSVGPLGYRFRDYQPRHRLWDMGKTAEQACHEIGVDPDGTPWTAELYAHAGVLGLLFVQSDPGWASKHDSYCSVLDQVGGQYERVVLARGDNLYDFRFLKGLLENAPWPCQFSFEVSHAFFLLDRKGMGIYRRYAEGYRKRSTVKKNWDQEMAYQPDSVFGMGKLNQEGIPHLGFHTPPWTEVDRRGLWYGVDHPNTYREARQRILDGWCS